MEGIHRRTLLAGAALVVVALLAWMLAGDGDRGGDVAVVTPGGSQGALGTDLEPHPLGGPISDATNLSTETNAAGADTSSEASDETDSEGSLLIRVKWNDGRPAPGIHVRVVEWGRPNAAMKARSEFSDDRGECRLENVRAGITTLYGDRGGSARADIEEGEQSEVELRLPPGHLITGRVVDIEGKGIAGAGIWLSDSGNGRDGAIVTSSDATGRFRIEEVGQFHYVGARHPPYQPSDVHMVKEHDLDLLLELRPGGAIVLGQVLDIDGEPIAGAWIRLEQPAALSFSGPDRRLTPQASYTRSGDDGHFSSAGLPTGLTNIDARANGYAAARVSAKLTDGGSTEVTLELSREAVVRGVVTDDSGAPVFMGNVSHGDFDEYLSSTTVTDPSGRYVLTGLPAGHLELSATGRRHRPLSTTVETAPGTDLRWDPILRTGASIVGSVVDTESRIPLPGLTVAAYVSTEAGRSARSARTDDEGGFALHALEPGVYSLRVHDWSGYADAPLATLDHVSTDSDPVVLEVDDALVERGHIIGRVLAPDGTPIDGGALSIQDADGDDEPQLRMIEQGNFRSGALLPGTYTVRVPNKSYGSPTVSADVRSNETVDVGEIRLQPGGTVAVWPTIETGVDLSQVRMWLRRPGGWGGGLFTQQNDVFRSESVGAGPATLVVSGSGIASEVRDIEIRSGEETVVEILVRRGLSLQLALQWNDPARPPSHSDVTITDTSGVQVSSRTYSRADPQLVSRHWLAPGRYIIVASDDFGARSSVEAVVREPGGETITIEM